MHLLLMHFLDIAQGVAIIAFQRLIEALADQPLQFAPHQRQG